MGLDKKIDTAKEVLADTKSRMIVVVLVIIAVLALVISYWKFNQLHRPPSGMGSVMASTPDIVSIPGMGQPTREYAKLQEQENLNLVAEAARKGTSAMPTVVRSTYKDFGFSGDLSEQSGATSAAGCGVKELTRARNVGVDVSELRCRGCSLAALKSANFGAAELRAAGFSADNLKSGGFNAGELRDAGVSANELIAAGYGTKELKDAGFTIGELKNAGSSVADLQAAGFSEAAIKTVASTVTNKSSSGNCDLGKLQVARSKGIDPTELKKLDCSVTMLKAAGFKVAELKAAGVSAKDLKDGGFSVEELRATGFTAPELREAGSGAKELKAAGFTPADLKSAKFSVGELHNSGINAGELKNAGFSAGELKQAGFNGSELSGVNFTPDELKAAGFTNGQLERAGIVSGSGSSPVAEVGLCSIENLKKVHTQNMDPVELKNRGCSLSTLKAANFTANELKAAGFTPAELKAAGFTPAKLKAEGLSAADLKAAGFAADELKAANFSVAELKASGFTADELKAAGFTPAELKATGLDNNKSLQDTLRMSDEQIANMTNQEFENFKRQQQAMMMSQATQLFAAWNLSPSQQYIQGQEPANAKKDDKTEQPTKEQQAAIDLKNSNVYKAGTIIFAVLDTEVNTDENSPLMATIVQGPLKGARALGNFQRVSEKALLQFKVLSIPKLTNSISMNAVAVDPNTDKTALATSVNNHYMLRYGTMLATSFMSGLGQAFQNAGGQIQTTQSGTIAITPALTLAQKTVVGLGNMAQQLGTAMAPYITMPPTVKVRAGTSVGLLLMADLAIPKNQPEGM